MASMQGRLIGGHGPTVGGFCVDWVWQLGKGGGDTGLSGEEVKKEKR